MSRPANFNDLPVEERTMIIQEEITKIEQGKSHNTHTMKRIRNRRLEIHNLMNPDVEALSYSQSEHESNGSESSKSKSTSNVSEHGSNVSGHGSNGSGSSKSKSTSNVSEHGSNVSGHGSNVSGHGSNVSDVSSDLNVNTSTGFKVFNDFMDDAEVPNYNKIQHFKERYLYLQNSKHFN